MNFFLSPSEAIKYTLTAPLPFVYDNSIPSNNINMGNQTNQLVQQTNSSTTSTSVISNDIWIYIIIGAVVILTIKK